MSCFRYEKYLLFAIVFASGKLRVVLKIADQSRAGSHFNSQNTHSQFRNSQRAFYPCPASPAYFRKLITYRHHQNQRLSFVEQILISTPRRRVKCELRNCKWVFCELKCELARDWSAIFRTTRSLPSTNAIAHSTNLRIGNKTCILAHTTRVYA